MKTIQLSREKISRIIPIDGRINSPLDWKKEKEQAKEAYAAGYSVLWNMNLGLFHELDKPIGDEAQFLSLALSLEHFRDTLWNEFKDSALCLYEGSADFAKVLGYGEVSRFFCRDQAVDYIQLLANRLPDEIPVYVMLDATDFKTPLEEAQSLTRERYERLHMIVTGGVLPIADPHPERNIAVLMPPMGMASPNQYEGLNGAFNALLENKIPFRIIPEEFLISEWDGLDYLLASSSGLSASGKRKLLGFIAAQGNLVYLDKPIEIPGEISFKEWLGHERHKTR